MHAQRQSMSEEGIKLGSQLLPLGDNYKNHILNYNCRIGG